MNRKHNYPFRSGEPGASSVPRAHMADVASPIDNGEAGSRPTSDTSYPADTAASPAPQGRPPHAFSRQGRSPERTQDPLMRTQGGHEIGQSNTPYGLAG